jgi:type IX secretion system PorP/SprF family membrane protein
MKRLFSIGILFFVLLKSASAQDPNFSQFFASPMTLNPALTGKFDGLFRVAGNYRNQWPTINNAFVTKTVSVDFSPMRNKLSSIDNHKGLDENGLHQIGAGFQGTYINKRLDVAKVDFEDELTPLGFTGVTSEIFASNQISIGYFDLNTGLIYTGSTDGRNSFYIGASMYHINRPKETFQGGQYLLNARTTIQAGGKIPIGQYNFLHVSAIHSLQAKASNTVGGMAFSYNVNQSDVDPVNVYLGAWYRMNDAAIPYFGLEFKGLHLGASYDVNTSALKPASNTRGGMEISLIYIQRPSDPDAKKLNCPRF